MIEVRNLHFRYSHGEFRLEVPELAVADGERIAFIGPSGCGKSTLASLIVGIRRPQEGSIAIGSLRVDGAADSELRRFRLREVGFIFQEFALLEYLNVLDNVLLPVVLGGKRPSLDERQHARTLTERLGVGDKLGDHPSELSQGEKQRVAICRALVTNPRLVVADEPTGNLDPKNTRGVMELLEEEVKTLGCTLLMITHDHSLLDEFNRVIDCSTYAVAAT